MGLTEGELAALLADATKTISGDIEWSEDEDHSPTVEFRVEVSSVAGYPLFVRGSFNQEIKALAYSLIHRGVGRIYGLCLGKDHHNLDCPWVGEKHKHRWDDVTKDKMAYVPGDITAPATDPVAVWSQFCAEAGIVHLGVMHSVPPVQGGLF